MDDNVIDYNMLKISCNVLIHDAIVLWSKSNNRSFISCFEEVMKLKEFSWIENGKIVELNAVDTLEKVIDALNSTIVAQIACYAHEIACLNIDIAREDKCNSFKNNKNIFVSEDIETDYQLLNFIRNAVSHNSDKRDKILYKYENNESNYTFLLNKEGFENSKVVVGKEDLIDFIFNYVNRARKYRPIGATLDINFKNLISNKELVDVKDFITIKNRDTKEIIEPDEYQSKVVFDIIKYLRMYEIEDYNCVILCYPYKQNIINNFFRTLDFYYYITALLPCQDITFIEYLKIMENFGTFGRREIEQKQDIPGLFIVNRMFQVLSSTSNEDLYLLDKLFEVEKYNKIRNSIMHGTYYKDFEGNYYFYDAPREKKTEEKLKFVEKLSINEFRFKDSEFYVAKRLGNIIR